MTTKNRKKVEAKLEKGKEYSVADAAALVKDISFTKFDASVDLCIRLGVDPRKADQMVRGTVSLPNGTGKERKVLVLCTPDKEAEAKEAGADYYGLEEYIEKIEKGWTDIDVIVAMPSVMGKIGRLGRVLGPRNLMPNPKSGTVTLEIGKTVTEIKKGKLSFKVDKYGIIHSTIGRVSFTPENLQANAEEFISTISKLKPATAKGTYFKSIYMTSTMSPSINLDIKSIKGL